MSLKRAYIDLHIAVVLLAGTAILGDLDIVVSQCISLVEDLDCQSWHWYLFMDDRKVKIGLAPVETKTVLAWWYGGDSLDLLFWFYKISQCVHSPDLFCDHFFFHSMD